MDPSQASHPSLSFSAIHPPPLLPLSQDPNDPMSHAAMSKLLAHHQDLQAAHMNGHHLDARAVAHEGSPGAQHPPPPISNIPPSYPPPMAPAHPERAPAPGRIPDFSTLQNGMYGALPSSMEQPPSSLGSSPSSVLDSSGLTSLVGSPSVIGSGGFAADAVSHMSSAFTTPAYPNGPPSDASTPPLAVGYSPERGYSSASSGTPPDGYHFQQGVFDNAPPPEPAPTVRQVFDQLSDIVNVASAARQLVGHGDLGRRPRDIMEQLKAITDHLFSSLSLEEGLIQPAQAPYPPASSLTEAAPANPGMMAMQTLPYMQTMTMAQASQLMSMNQLASTSHVVQVTPLVPSSQAVGAVPMVAVPLSLPTASMVPLASMVPVHPAQDVTMSQPDSLDGSRKRCASNVVDERAAKAIKLEPAPDTALFSDSTSVSSGGTPVPSYGLHQELSTPDVGSDSLYPHVLQMPQASLAPNLDSPSAELERQADNMGRRYTWSERSSTMQHRHTLSAGSAVGNMLPSSAPPIVPPILPPLASAAGPPPFTAAGSFGPPPISQLATGRPVITRSARSLSVSHAASLGPLNLGLDSAAPSLPSSAGAADTAPGPYGAAEGESEGEDEDDEDDEPTSPDDYLSFRGRRDSTTSQAGNGTSRQPSHHRTEVVLSDFPPDSRKEIDRIFFDFLSKICSDLDARDHKGEAIHQTLMAKKMIRMDESMDFRPFKFRIQAFTNAFCTELALGGFPETVLPTKKVRHYLWSQPHISRFNEDGRKAKSKGNHIWSISARKVSDTAWEFRPFERRITGTPPVMAYVGIRYEYKPRVWDPQNVPPDSPVVFSSPRLPAWLSWNDNVLSGVPNSDAQDCEVAVEADFVQDGVDEKLSQTLHIHVAPDTSKTANKDGSNPPSRRMSSSSLAGDVDLRRTSSDQVLSQPPSRRLSRASSVALPAAQDAQIVQVLQSAVDRIADAMHGTVLPPGAHMSDPQANALAKTRQVLETTVQAVGQANGSSTLPVVSGTAHQVEAVAVAAKKMVMKAAQAVESTKNLDQLTAGVTDASAVVTVKEVTARTQSAVAQAVKMTGTSASETHVLNTAHALLQQQEQAAHNSVNAARFAMHPHDAYNQLMVTSPGTMAPPPPPAGMAPPPPVPSSSGMRASPPTVPFPSMGLSTHVPHPGFVAMT